MGYIRTLPIPTVMIMSGGGYQLHYRLNGGADKKKFMLTAQMLSQVLNIDCCSSCEHLFRLPFSYNCKDLQNIRSVEILEAHDIGYSLDDFKTMIPQNFVFTPPKAKAAAKANICKVIREERNHGTDRSAIAFSTMLRIISEFPTISDKMLASAIKSDSDIYSHYQNETELRKDICRAREKIKLNSISAILPTEKMEVSTVDISALETVRNTFDHVCFSSRIIKMDATLKILFKLISEKQSGILNLPCSSGKTFSSIIVLAYLAERDKRAWFVSEKIEDCKRNADILRSLGVKATALHGRDKNVCRIPEHEFLSDVETHCRNCKNRCGAEQKYLARNKYDVESESIVCVTHTHYKSALFANAIPSSVSLIIIDEAPNLFESFSFRASDISKIFHIFQYNDQLSAQFEMNWQLRVSDKLNDKGSHFIGTLEFGQFHSEIRKYLYKCRDDGSISTEEQDFINQFLNFFSNPNIYGMRDGEGFSFKSGEINIDSSIQTIILDGSARNQFVKWKNFKIFECDELKMRYPRTMIHCLPYNPTQTKLSDGNVFSEIKKCAESYIHASERVLIFSNKDLSNKAPIMRNITDLKNILADKDCIIKDLPRGKHIGSNEGQKCSSSLITMSLFSTISDYVLSASIFYGKEFKEQEIFYHNGNLFSPKFKANGDFQNGQINDIYIRMLERDLYQAIMRGCIRVDNISEYKVIALISSPTIISMLK